MKIIGMQSICCGAGVRNRFPYVDKPPPKNEEHLYICRKCKKPCEHIYLAEIEREGYRLHRFQEE